MRRRKNIKKVKPYFKYLDLIRVIACIAILLYHLGILKGGYLAVCIFFVLSGYLSCVSAFNDDKFSFKKYYLKRIKKLYIPLILVVFVTIFVVSFMQNIGWYNLKPETTSILLGYNNFWQLGASVDYFASHSNSPFIHLWYISILIQFDLVFPFIYIILKKIGDKTSKNVPCVITSILSIFFAFIFFNSSLNQNMMVTYYNTFTRIFSLFFGVSVGFIHHYYGPILTDKMKNIKFSKTVIYLYLIILTGLFIFIDSRSIYFSSIMILVTLISCRLIDYSTVLTCEKLNIKDKIVKSLSDISYEIYLLQYPVIFLFQFCNMNQVLKIILIVIITIMLSYIFNFVTNIKNKKLKVMRYLGLVLLLIISFLGAYKYILEEDHTLEMKELEKQLAENSKKLEQNQENYNSLIKEEEEKWNKILQDLEAGENNIKDIVINLPLLGLGDSVMLGAIDNLHQTFPNSYVDAEVSRSLWKASGLLEELAENGMLGEPIVLNLGANGDCSLSCKKEIMEKCQGKEVFWLNTTNNPAFNDNLVAFSKNYTNLHVVDWNSLSKGHDDYFYADGIHLTGSGRKVYTNVIYNAIYQTYLDEYNVKKQEIIKQHEDELKNKISFYGNSLLLNAYDYLHPNFSESQFVIDSSFTFEKLKEQLNQSLLDNALSYKIVFAFDSDLDLSVEEYQELISMCDNHEIYIIAVNKNLDELKKNGVNIIDFYNELKKDDSYLLPDKKHLTEKGNEQLTNSIKEFLI